MSKKPAPLSAGLVAKKGQAVVGDDATPRQLEQKNTTVAHLNFTVDADFRRRFKMRAAESGLKLNELLREALDVWEEKQKAR